jgi:hypothetical protein
MHDFEAKKRELLQPLLFEAGAALMDCQTFEFGIALLLFHLSRHGTKGLDPDKVGLILDNTDKKTAGQLITLLKKHITVSDGIEMALEQALHARNQLIHRVLIDNVEQFPASETRAALLEKIRTLRSTVRKAEKMFRPFLLFFGELVGVKQEEMEKEVRKLFH